MGNPSLRLSEVLYVPFLCFKLYSLNFAIAQAQIKDYFAYQKLVILVLQHKKTDLSLETSPEINF